MRRTFTLCLSVVLMVAFCAVKARADLVRGGAVLGSVSPVVKISREGNELSYLSEGDVLYIFSETGDPVTEITVKNILSDVIYSEPLPDTLTRQIRQNRSILIFSNLEEYGDFIKAFLDGSSGAFRNFINSYPESELREEAQRVFDGIVYRPYKIQAKPQALDEFIEKYPDNYYSDHARKRRDDLYFQPIKEEDRIEKYRWFIHNFPNNINIDEARRLITVIFSSYEKTSLKDVAGNPRDYLGKKINLSCYLHSTLPVYVEGLSVGKKTASFRSPRDNAEYLNFQVEDDNIVLWRQFIKRENETIVRTIENARKGDNINVYGVVFDVTGGAPWIDVNDVEIR